MNEKKVEELMNRYKEELVIDEEFKRKLRSSFAKKKERIRWFQQFSVLGMAAAVLFVCLTFSDTGVSHVNASSLKIWNQLSFVDVGMGETVSLSEHQGTLYLALQDKGIFEYRKSKFQKILDHKVDYFTINQAGTKILFSADGSIGIYDLQSRTMRILLKGEKGGKVYSHPAWMEENIILVSKQEGNSPKPIITVIDLETMKEEAFGEGEYPSYLKNEDAVVYERDGQIFFRDLKNQQERQIDDGLFPAVSSDEEYIAYVKAKNSVENVWISDIREGTKKQLTANPLQSRDDNPPSEEKALFRFSYPVWSSDSKQVYVRKERNTEGDSPKPLQLTRIDLTERKLSTAETVKKYIQALMAREDDFAKSLLVTPPDEPLTGSNPRAVGYKILSQGTEGGVPYVDAEAYWSYTANPYYKVITSRYYLQPSENGYDIRQIQEKGNLEVTSLDDESRVKLITNGTEQTLFQKDEIPTELLDKEGNFRIASFAYNNQTHSLYFALQYMREENHPAHSSVILLRYDRTNKSFFRLDEIKEIDGKTDVGVSNLTVDPSGKFVSVDLYQDSSASSSSLTYLYNTRTTEKVDLRKVLQDTEVTNTYAQYWENGKTTFQVESNGQILQFEYAPNQ